MHNLGLIFLLGFDSGLIKDYVKTGSFKKESAMNDKLSSNHGAVHETTLLGHIFEIHELTNDWSAMVCQCGKTIFFKQGIKKFEATIEPPVNAAKLQSQIDCHF